MIAEVAAGPASGSLALLPDAAHIRTEPRPVRLAGPLPHPARLIVALSQVSGISVGNFFSATGTPAGDDADIPGLRPHRARHTFATRLRQGGADPAQVQALLGHASIDTAARYFRAGSAENAEVVERVFSD